MVGAFYFLAGPEGSGKKTSKLGPDATKKAASIGLELCMQRVSVIARFKLFSA